MGTRIHLRGTVPAAHPVWFVETLAPGKRAREIETGWAHRLCAVTAHDHYQRTYVPNGGYVVAFPAHSAFYPEIDAASCVWCGERLPCPYCKGTGRDRWGGPCHDCQPCPDEDD